MSHDDQQVRGLLPLYSLIMLSAFWRRSLDALRLELERPQVVIMPGGGGGSLRRRSSGWMTPGWRVALHEMRPEGLCPAHSRSIHGMGVRTDTAPTVSALATLIQYILNNSTTDNSLEIDTGGRRQQLAP